jgi:hypothetical protein
VGLLVLGQVLVVVPILYVGFFLRSTQQLAASRAGFDPAEVGPSSEWWRATLRGAIRKDQGGGGSAYRAMVLVIGGFSLFVLGLIVGFNDQVIWVISLVGVISEYVGVALWFSWTVAIRRRLLS